MWKHVQCITSSVAGLALVHHNFNLHNIDSAVVIRLMNFVKKNKKLLRTTQKLQLGGSKVWIFASNLNWFCKVNPSNFTVLFFFLFCLMQVKNKTTHRHGAQTTLGCPPGETLRRRAILVWQVWEREGSELDWHPHCVGRFLFIFFKKKTKKNIKCIKCTFTRIEISPICCSTLCQCRFWCTFSTRKSFLSMKL